MIALASQAATDGGTMRVRLVRTGAVLVAVGLMMTSCAQGPQNNDQTLTTTLSGYELQGDPASAISYGGNTNILSGELTGNGSPRKVDRVTEAGDRIAYIYTPVMVKVTEVYKGDRAMIGTTVAVRALGGQIGREKTVSETSPPPEAYRPGMKVYLFAPDFVDAGDGLVAATPNFTFAEDSGRVYNLHQPEQKTHTDSFVMMISETVAWSRPQSSS